jgi:hypothetical protein
LTLALNIGSDVNLPDTAFANAQIFGHQWRSGISNLQGLSNAQSISRSEPWMASRSGQAARRRFIGERAAIFLTRGRDAPRDIAPFECAQEEIGDHE